LTKLCNNELPQFSCWFS